VLLMSFGLDSGDPIVDPAGRVSPLRPGTWNRAGALSVNAVLIGGCPEGSCTHSSQICSPNSEISLDLRRITLTAPSFP
jgi:hypothetical protein